MQQYQNIIQIAPLFRGIAASDLQSLLSCLNPVYREYAKGALVFQRGEDISALGMVLSGHVHVMEDDFWGNRSILADIGPGDLFGEVYACLPGERLRVSVLAAEKSTALFLDVPRILTTCPSACVFHTRLMRNLLTETARKNLMLTRKLSHMIKRTTRDKLLSYLSSQSLAQGSEIFDIPFNRQQLADYLCVDRSAMSGELARLRSEGLLTFEKNHFHLKAPLGEYQ